MKIMITVEMKIEKLPVTDGVDEDDGDEDARDKKLTPLSSRRRCHQCASPPVENCNISNLNLQIYIVYKYNSGYVQMY